MNSEQPASETYLKWGRRYWRDPPTHAARIPHWFDMSTAPTAYPCIGIDADGRIRCTYFGKTSHVPLYGWNYLRDANDPESAELWRPIRWRPMR